MNKRDELIYNVGLAVGEIIKKYPAFSNIEVATTALEELAKNIPNFDKLLDGTGVVVPVDEPTANMVDAFTWAASESGEDTISGFCCAGYSALIQAAQEEGL